MLLSINEKCQLIDPSPQVYMFLDIVSGFQCLKSMQDNNDDCFDYEVQLCCPRKKLSLFVGVLYLATFICVY